MTNLNIDLSKIRDPRKGKFDSLELGPYTLTVGENKCLIIKLDNEIIAEYKNNDWLLGGYSVKSMWKCLENHYESLKAIIEEN